ncbi:MAG: PorT family protein [Saprospiraceae bacterium]|nr:PorT family protein [Saprospiraceae bacterium]
MKQILLTAIVFLFLGSVAQAQHINVGIKGGLNVYTIASDDHVAYNSRVGFNFGLLGHIHIDSRFAFQPEIQFSLQGTEYKIGGVNRDLNLNYVNVPLIFQFMFDNGFRLQAGPQVGFLASAKQVVGNNDSDVKSDYKGADLGWIFGLSYVKPSTGFGIDIRYNHGLTNINTSDATNSYNRGMQLSLFYLFQHSS